MLTKAKLSRHTSFDGYVTRQRQVLFYDTLLHNLISYVIKSMRLPDWNGGGGEGKGIGMDRHIYNVHV